jgi:hypothetical protein
MPIIHNPEAFARLIERKVRDQQMTYLDAILDFCERNQIEPEVVAAFVTDKMKTELTREGLSLNLLNRNKMEDTLPL